jgi:hypothetical protein
MPTVCVSSLQSRFRSLTLFRLFSQSSLYSRLATVLAVFDLVHTTSLALMRGFDLDIGCPEENDP